MAACYPGFELAPPTSTTAAAAAAASKYSTASMPMGTAVVQGMPVKRDPLLCGDLTSSADSGHWTDTERSPADARLHRDFAPDSGIATPVSLDDKAVLSGELIIATRADRRSSRRLQPFCLQCARVAKYRAI